MTKWHWNEERIAILREVYPTRNYDKLCKLLETDKMDTIRHKASELGITVNGYRFSEEEIEYLKNNYLIESCETLAKQTGRNIFTIYEKLSELNLTRVEKWTEEDMKLLKEVYPFYTNKYLKEKYFPNRAVHSIRTMALKNGLHKTKEKSVKWYDKEKMLEDLKQLSVKLNRTPLGAELSLYGLPTPKAYARYFGSYTKAKKAVGLKTLFSPFGRENSILTSLRGDDCFSKAEVAICDYLYLHGINYLKEEYYSKYCNDERCCFKRTDWVIDNVIVEYFGFPKKQSYVEGMNIKRAICRDCQIPLIEIFEKDLHNLDNVFKMFINKNS
jgi:hypothetical protein